MSDSPWEDSLLERKSKSDLTDLLKTLVAFANSVRPGHVATILIGELDDGTVQGVDDPDTIQKRIRSECDKIYPPIIWRTRVYSKEEKQCVQIDIDYDGETPHFGGAAWVRRGSVTVKATEETFQRLIDLRSSKMRELAKWLNKQITVQGDVATPATVGLLNSQYHPRWLEGDGTTVTLLSVNSFWATFEVNSARASEPLEKLTLSWDNDKDRLKLQVKV